MKPLVEWLIQSTWFKKYAGVSGGFCLGLWVAANYHSQIRAILEILGVSRSTYMSLLLAVVGAAGITTSIGLSVAKTYKAKKLKDKQEIIDV